ncbi:substrate-binding domain-containing protein [Campylobacter volucris]|uniref:substrate-binding domain-containing protein n=1 Tax=Campylobacter volucris TaxID=1031542 RepID=UPI00105A1CDA|nr:substrate-binding domain-containing protein [Campylobacter volucris]MBF7042217.1 substrate-binding domain-containing protein [Campylobacter volucris]MBF7044281.1 substrate-binding domain-containing protein [Campylobacter volucris]MBF7044956.1 substrate-binding domain-containing protein [Campylobacter volucris]MBF7046806.1 substrate-binding domain-containing protein [Campylobacter volucris]MBF7049711.1 substrate-binding domain-containing protein [Campylobacter volucris]
MKKILALAAFASIVSGAEFKIAGSSTVYPFTSFVAEEYSLIKKTKTPIVESLGTGGGFKVFCEGITDISNASRSIKPSEFEVCQKSGVTDIIGVMIGYDGIVLAQNKINAPLNITMQELFLALAKEVPQNGKLVPNPYQNWNQINPNLPNRKITIYGPPSSSGTRDTIEELIMVENSKKFPEYKDKYKTIRQDGAFIPSGENDNLIVSKLSVDKEAFGLFGYGFLTSNEDKINAVSIDGIQANNENISNGTYKLARSLFIYINAKKPQAIEFAKIYMSDDLAKRGAELEKLGLVPLDDELLKQTQKHLEDKTLLNTELVKAGKVF